MEELESIAVTSTTSSQCRGDTTDEHVLLSCFKKKSLIISISISMFASVLFGFFLVFQQEQYDDDFSVDTTTTTTTTNNNIVRINSRSSHTTNELVMEEQEHRLLQQQQEENNCTKDWCISNFVADPLLCPSENAWIEAIPFPVQMVIMVLLLVFSALFSGLTLGLMSLDCTGLEIVMEGEDEKNAEAARKIYSVRKDGNLLLCTLLLGNVLVNAFLSILMGELFGGIIALVGSTIMIVIMGEIVPQALCSRYALQIGSAVVPLIRVIVFMIYPFAYPMAFVLNMFLGEELVTTYSSGEMRKLLQIHVQEGRFDQETGQAMTGALKYKDISVKSVMTPREKAFMLDVDERLNFATIAKIFKTGYSRIPVYEVSMNNIIGLLFVKDLIFIDPEDETSVRSFVQIFGRGVHVVWPDDKLGDVLRELKKGKSHMALVRDVNNDDEDQDPFYEITGIITLEDIIEEIIGDEIVDETDAFVDSTQLVKVNRNIDNENGNGDTNFDWGRLRLLDANYLEQRLSHEEAKAVTAHLRINYASVFQLLSDHQIYRLVSETTVEELAVAKHKEFTGRNLNEEAVQDGLPVLSDEDWLYRQGIQTDVCTLILGGKVTVLAGADKFRSDLSSWSVLGGAVFAGPSYKPDFSAFVSGSNPCRCLRFTKARFHEAIDTSAMERQTLRVGGTAPKTTTTILSPESPDDTVVAAATATATATATSAVAVAVTSPTNNDDSVLNPPVQQQQSNAAAPSTTVSNTKHDTQQKRREASMNKRNTFIAALRKKVSPKPAIIEDKEEDQEKPVLKKRISFAPPKSGGLNSILTEGGTYQPKPLGLTTTKFTKPTTKNDTEFVSLQFEN